MASKKMEFQLLTFIFDGEKIEDIECNVEIDDDSQWKKVDIYSRDLQLTKIQDQQDLDVRITLHGGDGEIINSTEINKASVRGFSMSFGHATKITFSLFPKDVYIHQRVSSPQGKRKATLRYFINKAPMISPYHRLLPNEQGEVRKKAGENLHINLNNNGVLSSEVSFYYALKGDHFESNRYQVLSTSFRKKNNNIKHIHENITPQVNDFLMLTSLLHDGRVAFSSWELQCDGLYTWYYRSQALKADNIEETAFRELIERSDTNDFINTTLPVYQQSEYKHSIDNAIYTLILNMSTVVELSYLSYFQALESMILTHKRLTGTEFNFPIADFKKIRKEIEKSIDSQIEEKEIRKKLKDKLGELRRVSLKDAASEFLVRFNVSTENIWPLFDDKQNGITGLNTLRNVLIHGDLLPSVHFKSLAIASQHLRMLLIRCIFALLEWDVNKTKARSLNLVSTNFLFDEKNLKDAIDDIHEYFIVKNASQN